MRRERITGDLVPDSAPDPDPDAEPGLPIEWYQAELRSCRNRIADLEHMVAELLSYHPDTVGGER